MNGRRTSFKNKTNTLNPSHFSVFSAGCVIVFSTTMYVGARSIEDTYFRVVIMTSLIKNICKCYRKTNCVVTRLSSTEVQIISVYMVLLFGTINNTSLFQLQWFKFYLVVILVKLTILTELESILYVVKTKENSFLLLKNQTQFHITTA